MLSTFLFYPAKDDGIDTNVTRIHRDRSVDEIAKDPQALAAYRAQIAKDIAAAIDYNNVIAVPRYGRWMRKDGGKALDDLTAGQRPGFGGLLYPWLRMAGGEELLGISAAELNNAFAAVGFETTAGIQRLAGKKVTIDLRPRQEAFFRSIKREDLIHK